MNYWIVIDRQKFGPLTLDEARRMPLHRDSYVWHRGLTTWVRAESVPELADLFAPAEPETPAPPAPPTVPSSPAPYVAPQQESAESTAATKVPPPPPPAPVYPKRKPGNLPPAMPRTYLGWSIAALVCCCLVTGIVAVIYSSKVTPLYEQGRYEEAQKASEKAELWLILSFTLGLVALPFQFVLSMLP